MQYARAVLTRRSFVVGGVGLAAAACGTGARRTGPAPRPDLALGVQSGDPTTTAATVWARATRPGQLVVEWTTGDSYAGARRVVGPTLGLASDLCGHVDLLGLPSGATVRYRCHVRGPSGPGEAVEGRLTTAPVDRRAVSLVWSGDLAGQGWGQNPDLDGYRIFRAMRRASPDLFLFSGDLVYADDPLVPEVRLPDGRVWRNRVTDAKSRVAQTLDDFRGNFAYNLLDDAFRDFLAEVPIVAQWDDHEVRNNWVPGGTTSDDPRYQQRSESVLAARARRALFEYVPFGPAARRAGRIHRRISRGPLLDLFVLDCRSARGANGRNDEPTPGPSSRMLGDEQMTWLEGELARSRAVWKVIASDLPVGLVVRDGALFEGFAQGLPGPPAGREHEIARLLRAAHAGGRANLLFLTADVHYAAAHRYDPEAIGLPRFHELVAGPLHAGAFGPNPLDPTFGPTLLFQRAPPVGVENPAPWDGLCSFGQVRIAPDGELEATLHGADGAVWYREVLAPA